MLLGRLAFTSLLVGLAISSHAADWTVVFLHPNGVVGSECFGGSPTQAVGRTEHGDGIYHAALWNKTAASWVQLRPTGSDYSIAHAASGTKQGGEATFGSETRASLWSGTAASFVSLHPVGAFRSYVQGMDGSTQVGLVTIEGADHAALWHGTAASFVKLTPVGASSSTALAALGDRQYGASTFGTLRAGYWTGTAASWVSLHPAGVTSSGINCANGDKQGGYVEISGINQAAIWSGTAASYVNLHTPGYAESSVFGMLGTTQVGYRTTTSSEMRACLWTGTAGSVVDLHALLGSGYGFSIARTMVTDGVNDYIYGSAVDTTNFTTKAVMWVRPSPTNFVFSLNKTTVAGQNSVQGTITIDAARPVATVFTTFDNSSLVTTPATVTVAANTLVKNFQITVTAVTSPINTTVSCRLGTVTQSKPLTLAPLVPTALSFTPNPVTGGSATTAKVVINGVAGPGGRTIAILDNSPHATCPSTVVVPAGATQVTFPITTTPVTSQKIVTVTARVTAGEKTGTFRINP